MGHESDGHNFYQVFPSSEENHNQNEEIRLRSPTKTWKEDFFWSLQKELVRSMAVVSVSFQGQTHFFSQFLLVTTFFNCATWNNDNFKYYSIKVLKYKILNTFLYRTWLGELEHLKDPGATWRCLWDKQVAIINSKIELNHQTKIIRHHQHQSWYPRAHLQNCFLWVLLLPGNIALGRNFEISLKIGRNAIQMHLWPVVKLTACLWINQSIN